MDMSRDMRTLWCGNLSNRVTEDILYELFLQAGPLEEVKIPRDRDSRPRAYGFVTYKHDESVDYALELYKGTSLYGKELCIDKKIRPPSEQPVQQQQILLPIYNNSIGDVMTNLPYGLPLGYPIPYASQDQMGYRGPVNMHPSNHRRNSSRNHPYHRR
ncbi:splicing regulator RBM11 isoform X1 [Venturia canescens]|uniref:splicing regulator RBM11 isoform X1 n=1 Tax=Venturia canescens TaxID=32260 RepID=UPI001C9BDA5C|nr:splicing regulator RBM11 isoform X1 [Venturia canescens]XP_043286501.1 splicing regulator RBM11 isoform X1 [Venturia canescens]